MTTLHLFLKLTILKDSMQLINLNIKTVNSFRAVAHSIIIFNQEKFVHNDEFQSN